MVKKMLRTTIPLVSMALLVALLSAVGHGGEPATPIALQGSSTLKCPPHDPILMMHADIGEPALGAPLTPELAVRDFLRKTYPKLKDAPLRMVADSLDLVRFIYEPGSEAKGVFRVKLNGTGWFVVALQACDSTLREAL